MRDLEETRRAGVTNVTFASVAICPAPLRYTSAERPQRLKASGPPYLPPVEGRAPERTSRVVR